MRNALLAVLLLAAAACAHRAPGPGAPLPPGAEAPAPPGAPLPPSPPSAPQRPSGEAEEGSAAAQPITVAAVGDVMLGSAFPDETGGLLPPDDAASLLAEVGPLLRAADVAFGNLEGPLVDAGTSEKCARSKPGRCYAFRVPTRYGARLAEAGFDVMSVANNHAGDFGEVGRASTRAVLAANGIRFAGAPGEVARLEVRGTRVALVAFSTSGGTNDVRDLEEAARARRGRRGGGRPRLRLLPRRRGGRRPAARAARQGGVPRRGPRRPARLRPRGRRGGRGPRPRPRPPRGARDGGARRQARRLLARELRDVRRLQPLRPERPVAGPRGAPRAATGPSSAAASARRGRSGRAARASTRPAR